MAEVLLNEQFDRSELHCDLKWENEPAEWKVDQEKGQLEFKTDENTDYWQRTHYGFQADNGHFLAFETNENFRMTTKVRAVPQSKYDQAGLMLRFSEDVWLKTSLEYIPDGQSKLGAVVTNRGFSDWSTQFVDIEKVELYFRLSRIGLNAYADFSWDGETWNQIRIAHLDLPEGAALKAGLYACSPQGKDQLVQFDYLKIEKLSDDPSEAYL
ncbi:DUF1349 domain-containing protein [Jeotgalibacillus sp. R-1-5s-1]|uniref:DUF1349 domain-containing protein n=1 Tax=Jeotgalibacillus sp. R-1-5s-1 TaxID=2555897 RepID=UPI00106B64F0|nr:DUF1349 domain-containing protein [Jeotgalibacillus sp. R-1-5s-1]TFD99914.1 DUF1349 domain-containing protein [Jeotgalibacillus sp. R-1-5s-1]